MTEYIQVLTTTGRKDDAERIATMLIDERLAACVQILGPIASTYRWRGDVETSQEWLCVIKSREDLYGDIEKSIPSGPSLRGARDLGPFGLGR